MINLIDVWLKAVFPGGEEKQPDKGAEEADLELYSSDAYSTLCIAHAVQLQRRIILRLIDKAGLRPANSSGK